MVGVITSSGDDVAGDGDGAAVFGTRTTCTLRLNMYLQSRYAVGSGQKKVRIACRCAFPGGECEGQAHDGGGHDH